MSEFPLKFEGEKEPDRFDTELVVLVDREFTSKDPFDSVVADRNTGRTFMTDELPIKLLRHQAMLSPRRRSGMRDSDIAQINSYSKEIRARLQKWIGQDVLESMLDGSVKMAFLIDSDGGDVDVQNDCLRAAEYVYQRGGEVSSFVTGAAQSAGFSVMAIADKIHLMAKSNLLWHFSTATDGVERARTVKGLRDGVQLSKRNSRELDELFILMRRSCFFSREMKGKFLAEITHPSNYEGEVSFTGQELVNMRVANYCYNRVTEMAKWFDDDFVSMDNSFVKDFWVFSDLILRNIREDWAEFSFEKIRADLIKETDTNPIKRRRMRKRFIRRMHNEA